MSDEDRSKDGPAAKSVWAEGVRYALHGNPDDMCEIRAFMLDDTGWLFEFHRGDSCYPLRISRTGLIALLELIQHAMYSAPRIERTADHS